MSARPPAHSKAVLVPGTPTPTSAAIDSGGIAARPGRRRRFASVVPFGLGASKPHHYRDMLRVAWQNRDQLGFAWRILRDGVCDGCALGPRGLRDDVIDGVHLCMTRLELLRLNTMPALDPAVLDDIASLRRLTSAELRGLGRLPFPLLLERGARRFRRLTWGEAETLAAERLRAARPERIAFFTTSRGLTNETYYVAQKLARALGTNNVDNDARLCHAASTTAMKATLGVAAATCSLKDWIGTDLLVIWGSDLANNQPVSTKYMHYAKRAGTRIVVVNPYREPGLERYWVPSVVSSAVFGTRLMDDFFQVAIGGDRAFVNGVLKELLARDALDRQFIEAHTSGFEALRAALDAQPWERLEREAGVPRSEMARLAALYASARSAVFVWSMGLTQHRFGAENVAAIVNLALARGMLGRPKTGLMPIRGHSGVQGAAECGSVPNTLPGGEPLDDEVRARFAAAWGFPVPESPGLMTSAMLDAAHAGALDVFYLIGGNFLETMPDPEYCRAALARVPLRVHQDLVLNTSTLVEAERVLVLPAATRYEQRGGGTSTTTERRVRFSPEIPGRRIGEARAEWEILAAIGARALDGTRGAALDFADAQAIRDEMDRVMPLYAGVKDLRRAGESIQYGGPLLCTGGVCDGMPDGRARFTPIVPEDVALAPGEFLLTTRRGKQFNSMTYGERDALTGTARRDAVFMSAADAARLGLAEDAPLRLESALGSFAGRCRIAPMKPGCLQVYWPEGNVLIGRRNDPASGEPDYNAVVRVRT